MCFQYLRAREWLMFYKRSYHFASCCVVSYCKIMFISSYKNLALVLFLPTPVSLTLTKPLIWKDSSLHTT